MITGTCLRYRRNLLVGATASLLVYSAAAVAQTYGWSEINNFPAPIFGGATLTVLAMALTGTLIGLGLTPPVEKRKNLYILIPACTIMSSWALMLSQEWGYLKVSPLGLPPLAGILAAAGVVIIPALFKPDMTNLIIEAIKDLFRRIFNRPSSGGSR